MGCPVIESSHIIGKKWSIPIIEEIALNEFRGFNNFLAKMENMTPKILSMQLKELEHADVVKKKIYNNGNVSVTSYILTEKGYDLHEIVTEIKRWNIKWGAVPSALEIRF